ncbi:FecR family protein [Pedobacter gandavensis]|uniref:FecR family protein n=1 Tax=Pedobacter gandavensis TaxID=2679963 RepID=UPI002931D900|nr:FecR domain-containing protein [Pedobacter gandavensis]
MKKEIPHTELFNRYLKNACTTDEIELLLSHFGTLTEKDLRKSISEALGEGDDVLSATADLKEHLAELYKNMVPHLRKDDGPKVVALPFHKRKAFFYLAVACMTLIMSGTIALFYSKDSNSEFQNLSSLTYAGKDISAGGDKAKLTLGNGKVIVLNEASDGELLKVGGMLIRKTGNGQLVYEVAADQVLGTAYTYNIISTPKGGTYHVILPDGTKVWLNAASSLKFPTSFTYQKERNIELTGEAYFEVSKDAKHPFRVHTPKQEVEVLGTHFNISSYVDELAVKTTLFEGSVKVSNLHKEGSHIILKPGEQSVVSKGEITVAKADLEEALAWKNGLFVFNDEPLEGIMKKVSRWYDVEVVYEPGLDKNKRFGGSVSRFDKVSKVLRQLELTGGVHFKIEEGRIIAMK